METTAESANKARLPGKKPAGRRQRSMLAHLFEAYLRDRGWPYIAVDEAKKAIFAAAGPEAFDYLIYSEKGPNLLVLVRQLPSSITAGDVELLTEWEKIFGQDFRGVIVFRADGWTAVWLADWVASGVERRTGLASLV